MGHATRMQHPCSRHTTSMQQAQNADTAGYESALWRATAMKYVATLSPMTCMQHTTRDLVPPKNRTAHFYVGRNSCGSCTHVCYLYGATHVLSVRRQAPTNAQMLERARARRCLLQAQLALWPSY